MYFVTVSPSKSTSKRVNAATDYSEEREGEKGGSVIAEAHTTETVKEVAYESQCPDVHVSVPPSDAAVDTVSEVVPRSLSRHSLESEGSDGAVNEDWAVLSV